MVTVSDPSVASRSGRRAEPGSSNRAPAMQHGLTRGAHETTDHLAAQVMPRVQQTQRAPACR